MSTRRCLLMIALLGAVTTVHAERQPIFRAPLATDEVSPAKRFAINPELGRAWVEIDVQPRYSETAETHRVPVPGLSFDRTRGAVIYQQGERTVVCATVEARGRWVFRHERVEPTGDCTLRPQQARIAVDDGFTVRAVEHYEVYFEPGQPADTAMGPG
ncbi:MAG TPA: hypothetical protein VFV27_03075 [Nevskiaceae bacterium]|nr:hypothetical protein [Nevskiaceae bacterium]